MKDHKNAVHKVELLAPAGSLEMLKAVIAAGADAVYIGGTRFGARAYADNPDEEALLDAIDYAHLRGVRVYMTVNTLLKEEELSDLVPYLTPYVKRGLDAVLVQDFGVLRTLHEAFPALHLHASTQMTVTGGHMASFLKKNGVTRIVPARELSLDELSSMKEESGLEIEAFIHGALCVCYSGQCLFSSAVGGRSGNRGRCAQPCRLPYETENAKGELLSPKDLCAIELLPDLINSGVTSLKIEGRMKQSAYAAGVVSIYRKYLDQLLMAPGKPYRVDKADLALLHDLYNRDGFTDGYFRRHNGEDMMVHDRTLSPAEEKRRSALYEKMKTCFVDVPDPVFVRGYAYLAPGREMSLTLTCDWIMSREAKRMTALAGVAYENPASLRGLSHGNPSAGKGRSYEDAAFDIAFSDRHTLPNGELVSATVTGGLAEAAVKQPLTEDRIRDQLSKLGGTDFLCTGMNVELGGDVFVPMKELNELRRRAVAALREEMLAAYREERPGARKEEKLATCKEEEPTAYREDRLAECEGEAEGSTAFVEATRNKITADTDSVISSVAKEKGDERTESISESRTNWCTVVETEGQLSEVLMTSGIDVVYVSLALPLRRLHSANRAKGKNSSAGDATLSVVLAELLSTVQSAGKRLGLALPRMMRAEKAYAPEPLLREIVAFWRAGCTPTGPIEPNGPLETTDSIETTAQTGSAGGSQLMAAQTAEQESGLSFFDGLLVRNYEEAAFLMEELTAEEARRLLVFDANLYTWNSSALAFWREAGIARFTAPCELSGRELAGLDNRASSMVVYGREALMVTAQCLRKNTISCANERARELPPIMLKDRTGRKSPVCQNCFFCYNVIYNSAPTSLAGEMKTIEKLGFSSFRLDFTTESCDETRNILYLFGRSEENGQHKNAAAGSKRFNEDKYTSADSERFAEDKNASAGSTRKGGKNRNAEERRDVSADTGFTKVHFRRGVE